MILLTWTGAALLVGGLIGMLVRIGVLALVAVATLRGIGVALSIAPHLILLLGLPLLSTWLARFIHPGLIRVLRSSRALLRAARILVTVIVRILAMSIVGHSFP
jgi:hypothetical protein